MFARVTEYKMKSGSRDAATEKLNAMKSQIMAMPGMLQFVAVMNEDGTGYVVALVESEEISNANAEAVAAAWAQFSDLLEATPSPNGYDVIANWTN
ncbi:antibiotic biosynthesis monooxygenase [uncultured Aliiroseovarius sp.]|uniref:antibiotic biosynthesis monooxygenase n=1 Tax=uncultured Aliiroseovarius sp. TaxID=1658783 RepID=UPI00261088F3|nr:antibiotic biosynthesis monooxygenase [uncultured Aliiroseovarius sp.]